MLFDRLLRNSASVYTNPQGRMRFGYVLAFMVVFPALIWILVDKHPFGGDQSQYGSDSVRLFYTLVGYTSKIIWDTSRPNGQPRRKLDTSRAWREFSFQSQTSFEVGLRRTIDWYQQNLLREVK